MSTTVVNKVKNPGLQIVTGGVGAMGSKLVAPHVPGGALGKVALALAFGAIAGFTPNKGAMKHIKAAALGAGIVQFTEGASQLLQPTISNWADSGEPSKIKELAKQSVGLAAPNSSYYEELLLNRGAQMPETAIISNEADYMAMMDGAAGV